MTKKALLIIDAQNGVLTGSRPCHEVPAILERIAALTAKARAEGIPVLYVQDDDVGPEGSEAWQIAAAVAPQPGELIVRKTACDSFYGTNLDAILKEQTIEHLVIAGAKTEYCIDSAVRRATTLGYNVTLVGDAHTTSDTAVLPAAAVIAHANRLFDGFDNLANWSEVVNAADVDFK
ncbi:MAG TPA: cysteine hydrolase family protein [Symbiobacteriaceae bacterium]|nr:cysteine hydrolase family protein [Symbiobacteriaceae bacterium]